MTSSYKIVILDAMPNNEGRLEIEFLRSLSATYKTFYSEILKKDSGVARLKLVVKPTHSRRELEENLGWIRRSRVKPSGIHFIGHGERIKNPSRTVVYSGTDEIDLLVKEDLALFESLGKGWMLFSCCDIGLDPYALAELCYISGRDAVFAYGDVTNPSRGPKDPKSLQEYQAVMVDAMFYHLMLVPHQNFGSDEDDIAWHQIHKSLQSSTRALKIGADIKLARWREK